MRTAHKSLWLLSPITLFWFALNCAADTDPTIWTGPTIAFSKLGFADPLLPQNQDRLTDNVWLTRGSSEGMFNIAPGNEPNYQRYTSPADTRWATSVIPANAGKTISAANFSQLSFTTWAAAYGGPGPSLIGNITTKNAVVHLIRDNIYLDLIFTNFNSSGDFAYRRSTPVPEPATWATVLITLGVGSINLRRATRNP